MGIPWKEGDFVETLYSLLDRHYEEMVEIRRYLHQHPELSFKEVETPKYIAAYHKKLGHAVKTNVGGRGVVAKLKGGKPGKTIALRADFDALPIQEERDVPYRSKVDGVMHACGHDAHTAQLLVLAKVLNAMKDEIEGTIVFIHQHAEEVPPGGAIAMIEDGCLDGVDAIFGTHLWSTDPYGLVSSKSGPIMAAADRFDITIQGKGGHGANPHVTKDAIIIASQLVMNLQQIVSRRVNPLDPAVVTVASFEAINGFNIIADKAKLTGTVRTFHEKTRSLIEKEIGKITEGTCIAADASFEYKFTRGYPTLVNHEKEAAFILETAKKVPGVTDVEIVEPHMGGEDFAYYVKHVPGAFFFVGAADPEWDIAYPHHHPKFSIDEKAMLIAAKTLGAAVLTYQ
ncbi:amidohydrolase [Pueribacillus theae]|uniref:Amidohydrolase n=1 Tax=Pueribacillus theae TaxID=2171751 RepID=A0A2U1JTW8_9BACI|nr:amidohydrolase [Pueribacillus theae]